MVDLPLPITTELWLGGQWVDISGDVRNEDAMSIKRGRADEAGTADPSKLSLKPNNRHGKYSPRNPNSPYYGQLGRNTPIRVRVGSIPEPQALIVVDTFAREVTDGWGTADTGQDWSIGLGDSGDFSVASGSGTITIDDDSAHELHLTDTEIPDEVDVTATVSLSDYVQGTLPGAVYAAVRLWEHTNDGYISCAVGFRVVTGAPDGQGWVSASISSSLDGVIDTDVEPVPGVLYAPDKRLRVRIQSHSNNVRMRVWEDGSPEPTVWHAQTWYPESIVLGDTVTARTDALASAEVVDPLTMRWYELELRPHQSPPPVVRYVGEIPAWPPRWDVSDADVWVPLKAAGIKRRLGQRASPERSLARETYVTRRPPEYWPLEDGPETTRAASAVGNSPLQVSGLQFEEDDSLVVSESLPTVATGAQIQSSTLSVASTGAWAVSMLMYLSENDAPDEDGVQHDLLRFHTTGGTAVTYVWHMEFSDEFGLLRRVFAYDGNGTELDSHFIEEDLDLLLDQWVEVLVQARQDGSNVTWETQVYGLRSAISHFTETSFSGTVGSPSRIDTTFGSGLTGMSIGHVAVWGNYEPTATFEISERMVGGEHVGQRLSRLAASADVPLVLEGAADTPMGAQPTDHLIPLLEEGEAADLGALTEQRSQLGLRYRGRDTFYNQDPALVLDYSNGEIFEPIEPTDDDQQVRNDVTVERDRGSEARSVDEDGPMGVSTIGRYDESVTVNVAEDSQLPDQAAWRIHLGTVDELRIPTLTLNLANPRMRQHHEAIMALDTGDRIQVTNPPIWVGGDTLDLIVQGYEETLSLYQWEITLNCTPASPWIVAEVADAAAATSPPEDDFGRTETDTWGTSSSGHTWSETGGDPTDREVSGGAGLITLQATPDDIRFQRIGPNDVGDAEVLISVSVDQVAEGEPLLPGVLFRWESDTDFYRFRLRLNLDGTVGVEAERETFGVFIADAGVTYAADDVLWLRARVDRNTLRGKVWRDGDVEPARWRLEHEVPEEDGRIYAGSIGVVASSGADNTNTNPTMRFHSFHPLETVPDRSDRVDTDGSELVAAVDSSATTLEVRTTQGPGWTNSAEYPDDFPFDIRLGGEVMRVTTASEPAALEVDSGGDASTTAATDHVAPSVDAPREGDLLVCSWIPWDNASAEYAVPASMTEQAQTPASWSRLADATEVVAAGASGTRTATRTSSDQWAALSVVLSHTSGITAVIEEHLAGADGSAGDVDLTTSADTEAGWLLLAIHGYDSGSSGTPPGPTGAGWEFVGDTGLVDPEAPALAAYTTRVEADGAQTLTFPGGSDSDDNQARVYVLSGTVGQVLTVTRSINGITKSHTAGTDVRLAQPAIVAL